MFSIIMHHDKKHKHIIFLQGKQLRRIFFSKIEKTLLILTNLPGVLCTKLLIWNENYLVHFNWIRKKVIKKHKIAHLVKSGAAGIWTRNLRIINLPLSPTLCRQKLTPPLFLRLSRSPPWTHAHETCPMLPARCPSMLMQSFETIGSAVWAPIRV